jgi:hypothetical protein
MKNMDGSTDADFTERQRLRLLRRFGIHNGGTSITAANRDFLDSQNPKFLRLFHNRDVTPSPGTRDFTDSQNLSVIKKVLPGDRVVSIAVGRDLTNKQRERFIRWYSI